MPDSMPVFRADARLLTSLTAFSVNDIRSRASAQKNWRLNLASNLW